MPRKKQRRPKAGDPNYPYIYKQYGDRTVKSRVPVFTLPWSKQQQAVRTRLRAASDYAIAVAADPAAVAFYRKRIKELKKKDVWTVRNAAMADFFGAPEITGTELRGRRDRPGAELRIIEDDRFGASQVTVQIRSGRRVLVKEAAAEYVGPHWRYTFPEALPGGTDWEFVVTATDRPGNRVTKVLRAGDVEGI